MIPTIVTFRGARAAFAIVMRAHEGSAGARVVPSAHRRASAAPAGLRLGGNRLGQRDPDRVGDGCASEQRRRRCRRRRTAIDDGTFRRDDVDQAQRAGVDRIAEPIQANSAWKQTDAVFAKGLLT